KAAVPELQMPIGRENSERFEQAVERGGPGAQQRVAGRGKRELLGAVLGDQHQPPVGHRIGDDAQVRLVRERPGFLARCAGAEPLRVLASPSGEIAYLRSLPGVARVAEETLEIEPGR